MSSYFSAPFLGNSMLPFLVSGDKLIISNIERQLEEGDIVIFKDDDEIIAHRIVVVSKQKRLKGDRSLYYDTKDPLNALGFVVGIVRNEMKIVWGEKGQPLKKLMAKLSTYTHVTNLKAVRWSALLVIEFLNYIILRFFI